jgi:hypothetical protein
MLTGKVTWMYWPHELPGSLSRTKDTAHASGRRPYHGKNELVASNHMEVLDVLTFAGKADVFHWLEEDDDLQSKLFWRQTFSRETHELSVSFVSTIYLCRSIWLIIMQKIREHCVCGGHFNPDIPMDICENPDCKVWLHEQCIIDDVLEKTYAKENGTSTEAETNGDSLKTSGKKGKTGSKPWTSKFTAKVNGDDQPPTITITDLRSESEGPKSWTEAVECLKCKTPLL